jgi:hypothetical protein
MRIEFYNKETGEAEVENDGMYYAVDKSGRVLMVFEAVILLASENLIGWRVIEESE